jgi:hypothetical protein
MNPDNKFHPEALARRAQEHETSAARHIVSNPLRYREPVPPTPPTLEDKLEQAYWDFDTERQRTGAERDAFKGQLRQLAADLDVSGWPETKDEKACGCLWKRVPHGWGGYYYDRVICEAHRIVPTVPVAVSKGQPSGGNQ